MLLEQYAPNMTAKEWIWCYVDGLKDSYKMILGGQFEVSFEAELKKDTYMDLTSKVTSATRMGYHGIVELAGNSGSIKDKQHGE